MLELLNSRTLHRTNLKFLFFDFSKHEDEKKTVEFYSNLVRIRKSFVTVIFWFFCVGETFSEIWYGETSVRRQVTEEGREGRKSQNV